MTRNGYLAIAAAGGIGFILWKWGVSAPALAVKWLGNVFERGAQLSFSTLENDVITESPDVLQIMASGVLGFDADMETYSLARMGRSEGVDGMEIRMHVLLNDLTDLQNTYGTGVYSSITALLTHSKIARADGHYSRQNLGKRYATTKDPYEGDYALAQKVRSDHLQGIDPSGGAVKFVDKDGPLYVDGQRVSYDEFVQHWAKDGLSPKNVDGATSNFVVFSREA